MTSCSRTSCSSRRASTTTSPHTSGPGHARMFYVLTRDFKTFTYPPTTWQDTGYARIDSTVTKIDDYYYRFTKNEDGGAAGTLEAGKDIFLERSKVLTAPTTQSNWTRRPQHDLAADGHVHDASRDQPGR